MGGGTPIGMLRKDVIEKAKQMEQQHVKQYMGDRNIDIDDQRQKDEDAIDDLINQINTESDESISKKHKSKTNGKNKINKINKLNKSKKGKNINTDNDPDTDDDKKDIKIEKKSKFKLPFQIPEFIKDPLLIWVIFILLSQNFIKQLIGKYVKQINPNEEGVVSFIGVVIYGLIFAVLFGLIKFLLNMIL